MMKIRLLVVVMTLCISMGTWAQNILDSMPYAVVHQDTAITMLLESKNGGAEAHEVEIDGYRVQVYSSNRQQVAKAEAMTLEQRLHQSLDVSVYVQYMPPFWKVRLGDFVSYEQAQEYKEKVIGIFPEIQGDTYVVRDKIHVIQ